MTYHVCGCSNYKSESSFVLDMDMCDKIGLSDGIQRISNINLLMKIVNLYINYIVNSFDNKILFDLETNINDKRYTIRTNNPRDLAYYFVQIIKKMTSQIIWLL
jgi:secreted Zn-dependent insulinase-like peptidase